MNNIFLIKKFAFLFLFFIVGFWLPAQVNSQTPPQIILTWRANNFYPSDYSGKALPTNDSFIIVSLEILKNNKLIDISKNNIAWYHNGKPLAQEIGLKSIIIKTEPRPNKNMTVKAAVQIDNEILESLILVPLVNPRVIIDIPYPQKSISANTSAKIKAIPYFFNIELLNELVFFWDVQGQRQKNEEANVLILNVGLPFLEEQKKLKIVAVVQNKTNPLEISKIEEEITILK